MKDSAQGGGTFAEETTLKRRLEQLCRFSGSLGSSSSIEKSLEGALEPLLAMTGADRALVALAPEQGTKELRTVAQRGWPAREVPTAIPAAAVDLGAEARGFEGPDDLPRPLRSALPDVEVAAVAAVPIGTQDRLSGVAILVRNRAPGFSDDALDLLTAASRQLALWVENSRLLSDLRSSYERLINAQEGLIRSERMAALGQLSATLAHEIRNPLATIFSAISQIRKHSKADDVSATLLDIAEEEAIRLNRMVSDLLEYARPRKPCFEERHPLELAREVIAGVSGREDLPDGVRLEVDPASDDPIAAVDPVRVERAIEHLVSNALQSLGNGGGRVVARVVDHRGSPDGGVIVEVEDDGEGIPDDVVDRVCDPFFSTKPTGTGLGLPTVRRIAEDHGGCIDISSEEGRGTRVRLFIRTDAESIRAKEESQ